MAKVYGFHMCTTLKIEIKCRGESVNKNPKAEGWPQKHNAVVLDDSAGDNDEPNWKRYCYSVVEAQV